MSPALILTQLTVQPGSMLKPRHMVQAQTALTLSLGWNNSLLDQGGTKLKAVCVM